jgi:hypothetical protein
METAMSAKGFPKAPTCQHSIFTLVGIDWSTWPSTEVYECDTCQSRYATPWTP